MRLAILGLLGIAAAFGQSSSGLKDFLMLTPAQTAQVMQLNAALDQAVNAKRQRGYVLQNELSAEYAKPSPDPLALGQRYQELDTISHDIATLQAGAVASVSALLTDAQKAKLAQIADATVKQSLVADASCAFLAPSQIPTFAVRSGTFSSFGNAPSLNLLGGLILNPFPAPNIITAVLSNCGSVFPISIRDFLGLTDTQVAAIQGLIAASNGFTSRKQARVADVQVEIRDKTARSSPDALALGVRYVELNEITQELQQNDQQGRAAARALLNASQSARLQMLLDAFGLGKYVPAAESCRFISPPAGNSGADYTGSSCASYF